MRQWRASTKQRFDELPCVWLHSLCTFETFPFEMTSRSTITVMLRRALQTPTIMPFSCSVSSGSRTTLSNPFTCKASVKMELLFHAAVYVETLLKKMGKRRAHFLCRGRLHVWQICVCSSVNAVCLCLACVILMSVTAFIICNHFLLQFGRVLCEIASLDLVLWPSFVGLRDNYIALFYPGSCHQCAPSHPKVKCYYINIILK